MGMRSGDLGGHSIRPLRPIHPTSFAPRRRNDVVVHLAESKTNVVLRVAFRTLVVPTQRPTVGGILRPSFFLPGILISKESLHVSRTTQFGDEYQLRHENYPKPSARCCVG